VLRTEAESTDAACGFHCGTGGAVEILLINYRRWVVQTPSSAVKIMSGSFMTNNPSVYFKCSSAIEWTKKVKEKWS